MFWAILAYLLISYAVGSSLFCMKIFRQGYTPLGITISILFSPIWIIGFVVAFFGILLLLPLIYFHDHDKILKEELPEAWGPPPYVPPKYKAKFGANSCVVKDI